jgi:hypothetical protein
LQTGQSGLFPADDDLWTSCKKSPALAGWRAGRGQPDAAVPGRNRLGIFRQRRAKLTAWRTTTPCIRTIMVTTTDMIMVTAMIMGTLT